MGRLTGRLVCFGAKLAGARALRHVRLAEAFRSCFLRYDGLKRRRLERAMRVEEDAGLLRISLGGRTIYWPSRDSLPRVVQFYLETFDPANPHCFESGRVTVAEGDVVLDVGAAEGFFALKVRDRASKIVLFEPARAWRRCLEKTFEVELAAGRMVLAPVLLGCADAEVAFVEDSNDPGLAHILRSGEDAAGARPVPMLTIDSFVAGSGLNRVDFIKADVEGAELDLLKGAEGTIARDRPKMAITTYHHHDHAAQLVDRIRKIDPSYRCQARGVVWFTGGPRPVIAHFRPEGKPGTVAPASRPRRS